MATSKAAALLGRGDVIRFNGADNPGDPVVMVEARLEHAMAVPGHDLVALFPERLPMLILSPEWPVEVLT